MSRHFPNAKAKVIDQALSIRVQELFLQALREKVMRTGDFVWGVQGHHRTTTKKNKGGDEEALDTKRKRR